MIRAFLANAHPDERSALRLLLIDLNLTVVGEAGDWPRTLSLAPKTSPDLILIDWGLISHESENALAELRRVCSAPVVIILLSYLDAGDQAMISSGADVFINKGEPSNRLAERLQITAEGIAIG